MIVLPFPAKVLWPNGRTRNHKWRNAEFQKHKEWAYHATLAKLPRCFKWNGQPIKLHYIITPKTAHAIDKDNCIAAMKASVSFALCLRFSTEVPARTAAVNVLHEFHRPTVCMIAARAIGGS